MELLRAATRDEEEEPPSHPSSRSSLRRLRERLTGSRPHPFSTPSSLTGQCLTRHPATATRLPKHALQSQGFTDPGPSSSPSPAAAAASPERDRRQANCGRKTRERGRKRVGGTTKPARLVFTNRPQRRNEGQAFREPNAAKGAFPFAPGANAKRPRNCGFSRVGKCNNRRSQE